MASQSDIDSVLQLINNKDIASLKAEDYDQFQYQGFDPEKLIKALVTKKVVNHVDDKSFTDDLLRMCALGLLKGSINSHNINKMSDKGKADTTALMTRYDIKMGGPGGSGRGASSEVITFPRVMAAFPHVTVRLAMVLGGRDYRGGPLHSYQLPDSMKVQVFPSVIPRDLDPSIKSFLLTAALAYSIDQSVQISRLEKPDLKALAATQANFVSIGHGSPVPTQQIRKSVFQLLGIADAYNKITNVVRNYQSNIDTTVVIPTEAEFKKALT